MESYLIPPRRKRRSIRGGYEGVNVEAGGRSYQGGHVHGPLSGAEIEAITAEGLEHRIVQGDPARPPRRHPDDTDL